MTTHPRPLLTLNNGVRIPAIGLGVFQNPPEQTVAAVASALAQGYRLIDTAASYSNERQVGEGLRQSGIPRGDVFLETKIWISDYGSYAALHAFEKSVAKLGVDRLDLLLLHQPLPSRFDLTLDAYRALEKLLAEGQVRAIGVSNFMAEHLQHLLAETTVVPAVNQIEVHPYFQHRRRPISGNPTEDSPGRWPFRSSARLGHRRLQQMLWSVSRRYHNPRSEGEEPDRRRLAQTCCNMRQGRRRGRLLHSVRRCGRSIDDCLRAGTAVDSGAGQESRPLASGAHLWGVQVVLRLPAICVRSPIVARICVPLRIFATGDATRAWELAQTQFSQPKSSRGVSDDPAVLCFCLTSQSVDPSRYHQPPGLPNHLQTRG